MAHYSVFFELHFIRIQVQTMFNFFTENKRYNNNFYSCRQRYFSSHNAKMISEIIQGLFINYSTTDCNYNRIQSYLYWIWLRFLYLPHVNKCNQYKYYEGIDFLITDSRYIHSILPDLGKVGCLTCWRLILPHSNPIPSVTKKK